MLSFGNGSAENIVIFGVDKSSLSHSEFLLKIVEGPTDGINVVVAL